MSFNKKFFTTGGIVASSAECNTDTADIFGDGNGKALYTFDYDGSDESANGYHLTPTGVTFGVGGNINYGLRGGESNSMMANTSIGYNYSDITVSWWVKLEGTGSTRLTFSNGGGLKFAFMRIHYNTTASQYRADLFTRTGTTSNTNSLVGYALIDTSLNGSWVHLAMRMGNTLEDSIRNGIYINGTKSTMSYSVGSATVSNGVDDAAPNRFYIGYYYSGALQEPFSIDIDHLRIFNRALTASEIGQLATEEACVHTATTTDNDYPTTNVAYYKLDNSAEDEKGSYDGTETDIEYRFGRFGQAAVFDGISSKISTNLDISPTSNFSVSFWVKIDTFGNDVICTDGSFDTNAELGFGFQAVTIGSKIIFYVASGNNLFNAQISSLSTDIWYHVVGVCDLTNNIKLYINGNLEQTTTYTSASRNDRNNFRIGGDWSSGGRFFPGDIDQVRIFSTALDSDQVSQLYNEKPETDTSNFKTVLYTGDGGSQYISNVGMDLETNGGLVWLKNRSEGYIHALYDSVRGAGNDSISNQLSSNTDNEVTWHSPQYGYLGSFDANGFSLSTGNTSADGVNKNTNDYVAWVWKGGGDAVPNTNGTITSQVSANTDAGFSIVKYTGNGTAGATIGHGLSSPPDFIIIKNIDSGTANWLVKDFATMTDGEDYIYLNETYQIQTTGSTTFVTGRSSNTFTLGGSSQTNASGNEHIAYCFHSVSEYSKIGTYEGGSTGSGNAISCGFQPSWLMVKCYDSTGGPWRILDQRRGDDTDGDVDDHLVADDFAVESVNAGTDWEVVFTSDGFYFTGQGTTLNGSNRNFLFMAFK